ncbi:MAG: hypothetical protein JJ896_13695 [Rhodothermales bacterium]|nr:hypothetical protein [Rhodothermales bacterium]MBO6780702.1 hypothetical protein [Rhodothermales bacterium]
MNGRVASRQGSTPGRAELLAYGVISLAMWPVPLLNRLHVESAAVLAAATFFIAGIAALSRLRRGKPTEVLQGRLLALVLPLALMLLPMLWAPNCGWLTGLGFFVLFPVVTCVLAVGVAAALTRLGLGGRTLVGVGVCVIVAGVVYDLGLHPQFYTYNHVFGGVLGPVYDEELAIRPGLFWFRGMTLVWALWGFALAGRRPAALVVLTFVLGGLYAFSGRLGINTTYDALEHRLPGLVQTPHFDIRFDPEYLEPDALDRAVILHEHEFERIAGILGVVPATRVTSYIYPHPWARQDMTGARVTSVAPVWLARPQIHVEQGSLEQIMPHELVHAFSREFGMPVLRASPAVGLVEGLAVALEPPGPRPSEEDLSAAALAATGLDVEKALPAALSPWGFWTGRGGVSYTITGAFTRYLIRVAGTDVLQEAYRTGRLAGNYGAPVADLTAGWRASLVERTWVDADARIRSARRLGSPSLFERDCPHYLPPPLQNLSEASRAWAERDSSRALAGAERALELAPEAPEILAVWSRMRLAIGDTALVQARLAEFAADSLTIELAWLRARLLPGPEAVEELRKVADRLPRWARPERTRARLAAGGDLPVWLELRKPAYDAREAAHEAFVAGAYQAAADSALRAVAAYRRIGDLTMARHVRYLADRYRFAAVRHTELLP